MATPAQAVAATPIAPTTPAAPVAPAPVESRTITLNVTDPDLIAEIDAWTDGGAYTFNVTQTAPDAFDVTDAYAAEEVVEEAAPAPAATGNPAIGRMLASKAA